MTMERSRRSFSSPDAGEVQYLASLMPLIRVPSALVFEPTVLWSLVV